MDTFADQATRDQVSPFVQLLWESGFLFEKETIAKLKTPFLDLSAYSGKEKEQHTLHAMNDGQSLIYGGRIAAGDLLGEPDLLRKEGTGYVAGDIKSGAGLEGGDASEDGKPKEHYAVQLGLYTDILERLGYSAGRRAFIWDIHGQEVEYDFVITHGTRSPYTLWQRYQVAMNGARAILAQSTITLPAYSSGLCKNCVWYSNCLKKMEGSDDLTLIPELGRSKRDVMYDRVQTIRGFAKTDIADFVLGKKTVFDGIGQGTLERLHARAQLISSNRPVAYLREPVSLPSVEHELFFDIEVDPMRDHCYLHGFLERQGGRMETEKYISFCADEPTPEEEKRAFADALQYLQNAKDATVYYYSKYERTIYRCLSKKYPDVCSEAQIEELFSSSRSIDMYYDVVKKATEWPTRDYSIKTLAKYLGFAWRDPHPSGAASIEWYHRWVETRDPDVMRRILEYNEDDCRATRVLVDGVRQLDKQIVQH